MIFPLIIIWTKLFYSFQEIVIVKDAKIVAEIVEYQSYHSNENDSYEAAGYLVNGGDKCHMFPKYSDLYNLGSNFFLLISPNKSCNYTYQILSAMEEGYSNLIYAKDGYFETNYANTSWKKYKNEYLLIFVSTVVGHVLSSYTIETNSILFYSSIGHGFRIHWQIILYIFGFIPLMFLFLLMLTCIYRLVDKKIKYRKLRSRVNSLPSRECTEDDVDQTCPICFETYSIGIKLCVLGCGHEYHQSCLSKWFGQTCPMCRAPFYNNPVNEYISINFNCISCFIRTRSDEEDRVSLISNQSGDDPTMSINELPPLPASAS